MSGDSSGLDGVVGCIACDLTAGRRELAGGVIAHDRGWVVEHCVGPLGVGTLIVKPERHVVRVAELNDEEVAVMGPLIRDACRVVTELRDPDQVYVCLWSHADRVPGHIHHVLQPVDRAAVERHDANGPRLQLAMADADEFPDPAAVEAFCERARRLFDR